MNPREATRFCLRCHYALDGLPDNRCPECGRTFDPNDPASFWNGPVPPWSERVAPIVGKFALSPLAVVLIFWTYFVFPLCLPLVCIPAAVSIGRCIKRRRWKTAGVTVFFCLLPFSYPLGRAVLEYKRGTAALLFMGLPSTEGYNIDPAYRCERFTTGCKTNGALALYVKSYNSALKIMIRVFGPMPRAYLGPYPTKADVFAALQNAEEVEVDALAKRDQVRTSSGSVSVGKGVGSGLLEQTDWGVAVPLGDVQSCIRQIGPITATTCQGCIVLRVPVWTSSSLLQEQDEPSALIVVIDPHSGRPFAYYAQGGYRHSFPPMFWRP